MTAALLDFVGAALPWALLAGVLGTCAHECIDQRDVAS